MDEALEENSADSTLSLPLDQNLICIIYHKVHVLVETKNSAHDVVFVEPNLHPISLLDVTEDLIDGWGHNLLQLFCHKPCCLRNMETNLPKKL